MLYVYTLNWSCVLRIRSDLIPDLSSLFPFKVCLVRWWYGEWEISPVWLGELSGEASPSWPQPSPQTWSPLLFWLALVQVRDVTMFITILSIYLRTLDTSWLLFFMTVIFGKTSHLNIINIFSLFTIYMSTSRFMFHVKEEEWPSDLPKICLAINYN